MAMRGTPSKTTELRLVLEQDEWWGAGLGALVALPNHSHLLVEEQRETDPVAVAPEIRGRLDELAETITAAAAETDRNDAGLCWQPIGVRRDGDDLVISPAHEATDLAWCLDVSAGVLEPEGPQAAIARGAVGYAAAAWSGDIGEAAGTLTRRRVRLRSTGPAGADTSEGGEAS